MPITRSDLLQMIRDYNRFSQENLIGSVAELREFHGMEGRWVKVTDIDNMIRWLEPEEFEREVQNL